MSKKIRVKLIMRLAESGMSQNAIARLHHISKRSISDVLGLAKENGIAFGENPQALMHALPNCPAGLFLLRGTERSWSAYNLAAS